MFSRAPAAYCRIVRRLTTAVPVPTLSPAAIDRLIVLALIAGGLLWAWPGYFPESSRFPRVDWPNYLGPFVLAVLTPLPLLVRRTQPILAFCGVIASLALAGLVSREVGTPAIAIFLGAYSLGRYTPQRGLSLGALLIAGAIGLASALGSDGLNAWFLFMLSFLFGMWLTGDTARVRELRAEQL